MKEHLSRNALHGKNNVLKDFLHPNGNDIYVKRGVNAVQRKCSIICASFLPSTLLEALQQGKFTT